MWLTNLLAAILLLTTLHGKFSLLIRPATMLIIPCPFSHAPLLVAILMRILLVFSILLYRSTKICSFSAFPLVRSCSLTFCFLRNSRLHCLFRSLLFLFFSSCFLWHENYKERFTYKWKSDVQTLQKRGKFFLEINNDTSCWTDTCLLISHIFLPQIIDKSSTFHSKQRDLATPPCHILLRKNTQDSEQFCQDL